MALLGGVEHCWGKVVGGGGRALYFLFYFFLRDLGGFRLRRGAPFFFFSLPLPLLCCCEFCRKFFETAHNKDPVSEMGRTNPGNIK